MQEFQAVILMSQMKRLQADARQRSQNAEYLAARLQQIPGIIPYQLNPGVTRAAYHLFPFRFKSELFNQVPRKKFIAALEAEGIPCSSGYSTHYRDGLIHEALKSKGYQRLFPPERLQRYWDELVLPENDQLCNEAVWFGQNMLLGSKADMDNIADAIQKVYENREKLKVS
jgi:perosamine synthetase